MDDINCDLSSYLYEEETKGLTEEFIASIYEMPKEMFKNAVRNGTLPELPKIPLPEHVNYPLIRLAELHGDSNQYYRQQTIKCEFEDWLYIKRFMLQYYTVNELFKNSDYGYEPHKWIDEKLEQKYNGENVSISLDSLAEQEEFKYNLEWDIEKGKFEDTKKLPKLRLYLPEEVGYKVSENDDDHYKTFKTRKMTKSNSI